MKYKPITTLNQEQRDYLDKRKSIERSRKEREMYEKEKAKERSENRNRRFDVALVNRVVPLKGVKGSSRRSYNRSRINSNINNRIINY